MENKKKKNNNNSNNSLVFGRWPQTKNKIARVTLDSPYSLSHSYIQTTKLRYDEDVSYLSGQLF